MSENKKEIFEEMFLEFLKLEINPLTEEGIIKEKGYEVIYGWAKILDKSVNELIKGVKKIEILIKEDHPEYNDIEARDRAIGIFWAYNKYGYNPDVVQEYKNRNRRVDNKSGTIKIRGRVYETIKAEDIESLGHDKLQNLLGELDKNVKKSVLEVCKSGKTIIYQKDLLENDSKEISEPKPHVDNIKLLETRVEKQLKEFIQGKINFDKGLKEKQNIVDDMYGNLQETYENINKDLIQLSKFKETKEAQIKLQEKQFQNLLIIYPQIIESGLKYLDNEYKLGDSNYRGDILFLDSNNKRLNVEIKIVRETFKGFKYQLLEKYIKNIDKDNERLMYIAPKITEKQKEFCEEYNIEWKEININKILKSTKRDHKNRLI